MPFVRHSRDSSENARRARARGAWPVRRYRCEEEPANDLSGSTTAEERLAMMWPLALETWTLTGRVLPTYSRSEAPVRKFILPVS